MRVPVPRASSLASSPLPSVDQASLGSRPLQAGSPRSGRRRLKQFCRYRSLVGPGGRSRTCSLRFTAEALIAVEHHQRSDGRGRTDRTSAVGAYETPALPTELFRDENNTGRRSRTCLGAFKGRLTAAVTRCGPTWGIRTPVAVIENHASWPLDEGRSMLERAASNDLACPAWKAGAHPSVPDPQMAES